MRKVKGIYKLDSREREFVYTLAREEFNNISYDTGPFHQADVWFRTLIKYIESQGLELKRKEKTKC